MLLARPALLTQSYRNANMDSVGLVAYWPLSETAGVVTKDETGKYDGVYTNAPTLGSVGGLSGNPNTSVAFNGSTQYSSTVSIPSIITEITVAAWVNPTSAATAIIVGMDQPTDGLLLWMNGGSMRWRTSGPNSDDLAGSSLTTNAWHFVAGTRQIDGTKNLFQDGILAATSTGVAWNAITAGAAYIATRLQTDLKFPGSIEKVLLLQRAMSAAEIARLYRIGRGF